MAVTMVGGRAGWRARLRRLSGMISLSRETGLLALIILQVIVFSIMFPVSFPTFSNFAAVSRNLAVDGIMATGMMLMLVGGVFDLSVGGMFSMIGVLTGWLMKTAGLPVPLAILIGLAVAALGGFVNGLIVAKVKVNALISNVLIISAVSAYWQSIIIGVVLVFAVALDALLNRD